METQVRTELLFHYVDKCPHYTIILLNIIKLCKPVLDPLLVSFCGEPCVLVSQLLYGSLSLESCCFSEYSHTTGVGTFVYASPEQLQGSHYDSKVIKSTHRVIHIETVL